MTITALISQARQAHADNPGAYTDPADAMIDILTEMDREAYAALLMSILAGEQDGDADATDASMRIQAALCRMA